MRAATAELRAFEHDLARAPGRTLASEARAQRQDDLTEELRRAGYCLGVLGAGARADLLRGRHEPDGLRWMLGELWAALDTSSTPPASALPDLELRAERAVGFLLAASWAGLMAARNARAPLCWAVQNGTLAFGRTRTTAELRRRAREVSAACAADLRVTPETLELALS